MARHETICPHCETRGGEIAAPCSDPVCTKNGYHFIPDEYYEPPESRVSRGAARQDAAIGQKIGNYLIVDKIGEGGMGMVYLALQLPLNRQVALKMIPAVHLNEEDKKRFEREAMSISLLYHPNIVSLHEYGVSPDTGVPYMVLEYVKGGKDLGRLMSDRRRSRREGDRETLLSIFTQVLNGLTEAHNRGLVHRDIKPQNIMLVRVEGNPHFAKILDFGLVRAIAVIPGIEIITSQGELWGTPEYMAPEQISETGTVDHRSDLYSLAVILLEMMTGKAVFRRKNLNEVFSMKLDKDFDATRDLPADTLDAAMRAFFRKALHVIPDERFQSAQEMKDALTQAFEAAPEAGVPAAAEKDEVARDEATAPTVKQPPPQKDEKEEGEVKTAVIPPSVKRPAASGIRVARVLEPPTVRSASSSGLWLKPLLALAGILLFIVLLVVWVRFLRDRGGGTIDFSGSEADAALDSEDDAPDEEMDDDLADVPIDEPGNMEWPDTPDMADPAMTEPPQNPRGVERPGSPTRPPSAP